MKSREENTLIAEVTGSRKRENGLVVPCIYHGHSPSHQVAKILKNELCKASKLYAHMQIELRGVSELMDRQGCAILALEVVPKNLIFA